MSAFIVGSDHIDAIVAAGFKGRRHGAMRWQWGDPRQVGELTTETATATGQMLRDQNHKSVDYRYDEESATERYTYRQHLDNIERPAVQVLKAIDCYVYQSCEDPGWESSEAFAYCEALRHRMVQCLPGYDDAEWEIRRPVPQRREPVRLFS